MTAASAPPDHWRFMAEFARYERAAGGPDPHLRLVGHLSRAEPWAERVWRIGCYGAFYNAPCAEVLWLHWPWERVLRERGALPAWCRDNWPRLVFRRERRPIRTPEKLARYLDSYATWAERLPEHTRAMNNPDGAWRHLDRVWGVGRYIKIKMLECLARYCDLPQASLGDLRAQGGWSPREGLALLFPEYAGPLTAGDTPSHVMLAEMLADKARGRLAMHYGVHLSWFELQVCLCDYKQSFVGRRQFPGRSIDSEMAYTYRMQEAWHHVSGIWPARLELFAHECLGELHGWRGVREELGSVVSTYRYTWTDTRYLYAPGVDLSHPPMRASVVAA